MLSMPSEYLDAMRASTRQIDAYLAVGINIDQTAADDITSITVTDSLPMSNKGQLTDAIYILQDGLATFERYGIKTAISAGMVAPPVQATAYPPEVGLWSYRMSDADGSIDWTLDVQLSKAHTSAFTIYTREVNIIDATITFYNGGSVVATGAMEAKTNSAQYADAVTYDRVVVNVTRLDTPYSHIRIAEMEFGASKTFSKDNLTGTVSLILETDFTMQTSPIHELDFTVLNVLGEWDPDNPIGYFDTVPEGYPVEVGFTCTAEDGTRWTVPYGRYMISEKNGSDVELKVVCYDMRKGLQNTCMAWGLSTDVDLGTTITDVLTDMHIAHIVDSDVFDIIPTDTVAFDPERTLMEDFLFIEQRYDVWLNPGRDGYIHVQTHPPQGEYGKMPEDMMYTYPLPYGFTRYNFVQVSYPVGETTEYFILDKRTTTLEIKSQLTIDNPLIRTREQAQALANKLYNLMFSEMMETEWRTDLTVDIGDDVGQCGRWSNGVPTTYRAVYQEITYDGGISEKMRGAR